MASHHHPGTVIPLHRGIADQPRDYPVRPLDLIDEMRRRHFIRPTLLERVADFLGSDRGISFMLGFLSGALFAVAVALVLA